MWHVSTQVQLHMDRMPIYHQRNWLTDNFTSSSCPNVWALFGLYSDHMPNDRTFLDLGAGQTANIFRLTEKKSKKTCPWHFIVHTALLQTATESVCDFVLLKIDSNSLLHASLRNHPKAAESVEGVKWTPSIASWSNCITISTPCWNRAHLFIFKHIGHAAATHSS